MADISQAEQIRLREVALGHACGMHPSIIADAGGGSSGLVAAATDFYDFLTTVDPVEEPSE